MKTILFNKEGIKRIEDGFMRVVKNGEKFFAPLKMMVLRDVDLMFKGLGNRPGISDKWKPFSIFTLHPSWKSKGGRKFNMLKWRNRRGTDGSKSRRYSASSKMMQASGSFRKSFRGNHSSDYMRVETNHQDAEKIMSGGGKNMRQVIVYSKQDEVRYRNLFQKFLEKNLKKEI